MNWPLFAALTELECTLGAVVYAIHILIPFLRRSR